MLDIEHLREVNGYWVDDRNNRWNATHFNERDAWKASRSLIDCHECVDSKDCISCFMAVNCSDCMDCRIVEDCRESNGLRFCKNVIRGVHLTYSRNMTDCSNVHFMKNKSNKIGNEVNN